MKQKYLFAGFFLVAVVQLCYGDELSKSANKKPNFVSQELEIKGARIGFSPEQLIQDFGATCYPKLCNVDFIPALRGQSKPPIPEDKKTFASAPIQRYTFDIYDGRLTGVNIYFSSIFFESAYSALVTKYGKPQTRETETLQNGYGAQYTNHMITWKAKDGSTLQIVKYLGDIETTYIFLRDKNYLDRLSTKEGNKLNGDI